MSNSAAYKHSVASAQNAPLSMLFDCSWGTTAKTRNRKGERAHVVRTRKLFVRHRKMHWRNHFPTHRPLQECINTHVFSLTVPPVDDLDRAVWNNRKKWNGRRSMLTWESGPKNCAIPIYAPTNRFFDTWATSTMHKHSNVRAHNALLSTVFDRALGNNRKTRNGQGSELTWENKQNIRAISKSWSAIPFPGTLTTAAMF